MGKTVSEKGTKIADFCTVWKFQLIYWDIGHNWYLSALLNLKLLIVIISIIRKFCCNIIKFVCWTTGNGFTVNVSLEIDGFVVTTFFLSVTWFLILWIKFRHVLHVKLRCLLNALHSGYCCHADAGAHSGEFIYGLESFVYKDIKPGGYAWFIISSYIKNYILIHSWAFNGAHLIIYHF